MSLLRLNWACGPHPEPGWLNSDILDAPGIDLPADIRKGLPLPSDHVDYAVAIHALQDMFWPDIPKAVSELHRVLKPGGVLRLAVPDLDRAIDAYRSGDTAYFYVPDEHARSAGAKLIAQIIWYGSVHTPMVYGYVEELLVDGGFERVTRCAFGQTASRYPDIVQLDNRPRESMFVEAVKPAAR